MKCELKIFPRACCAFEIVMNIGKIEVFSKMDNRRRLLLKLRLMKLRRKAFLLSSQLYGNQRMYQRGLSGDRLFCGEFALCVTEMRTFDREEFFVYFEMDRPAFHEILASIRPFIIHKTTHRNPNSAEERLAITLFNTVK